MGRTASYTEDIKLEAGAPVARPRRDSAPDLSGWVGSLRTVDQATRQVGKADIAVPFNVPAAAAKTAKLRFQQAASEMGIGVSITIETVNDKTSRLLVTTMARRQRKDSNGNGTSPASGAVSADVHAKAPVGLPKPVKR